MEPCTSLHTAPRSLDAWLLHSRSQMPIPQLGYKLLTPGWQLLPLHLTGGGGEGGGALQGARQRFRAHLRADSLTDQRGGLWGLNTQLAELGYVWWQSARVSR